MKASTHSYQVHFYNAAIFLKLIFLSLHMLTGMNVMLIFICIDSVEPLVSQSYIPALYILVSMITLTSF